MDITPYGIDSVFKLGSSNFNPDLYDPEGANFQTFESLHLHLCGVCDTCLEVGRGHTFMACARNASVKNKPAVQGPLCHCCLAARPGGMMQRIYNCRDLASPTYNVREPATGLLVNAPPPLSLI